MSLNIDSSSRITGFASGLDTDEVIKGLMTSYQTKLDKQEQRTTKFEWTSDAYRDINKLIKNFRSEYMSVLSDKNMMTASSYRDMSVSMQTSTSAASVTASPSAIAGTYTIDSITQLATSPKTSSEGVFTGDTYLSDTTLADLELANAFAFDVNGELSFSINGETFTFTEDTTIASMMREINTSSAGVTMRFSNLTKGFSLSSDTTGSESSIEIVNITGNAFSAVDSALGIAEGTYTGQDAICSIEGIAVTQSSNTFSFDGITYTLSETSGTAIEFTVNQDYQSSVDSIVAFVDSYNELIGALQDKIQEKINYDYDPLTDTQKEEMTEDEIEKWEEKAKSGTLHNDAFISSLLTSLRGAFYATVDGAGMSMADIGLTTGIYSDGAKITVDQNKLLNAIKQDPESVKNMFVQTSETDTYSEKGLMTRISDSLLNYTKETTDVALDSLERRISDSEDKQDALEDRMKDKEESLWRKFSEMEAALAKLNSLSGWLSSLFVY